MKVINPNMLALKKPCKQHHIQHIYCVNTVRKMNARSDAVNLKAAYKTVLHGHDDNSDKKK